MKIVTGYTGTPHVTSNAAQAFNQGVFGFGNFVLDVLSVWGNHFAATLTDANTVTIQDGDGLIQGVHFRIDPGTTEAVTISNGTSGYKRIDLICARYTKNALTGIEDVSLVVIEGTPDASTPTEPTYNAGSVLNGDSPVDFPLYKVSIDGLTPTLTALFEVNPLSILPPDITRVVSVGGYAGTSGDLTISATGWYALLADAEDKRVSFKIYNSSMSATIQVAAGVGMTPWVYLKNGISGLKYGSNATVTTLVYAPSIGGISLIGG